jgi:hypothetical protein
MEFGRIRLWLSGTLGLTSLLLMSVLARAVHRTDLAWAAALLIGGVGSVIVFKSPSGAPVRWFDVVLMCFAVVAVAVVVGSLVS